MGTFKDNNYYDSDYILLFFFSNCNQRGDGSIHTYSKAIERLAYAVYYVVHACVAATAHANTRAMSHDVTHDED